MKEMVLANDKIEKRINKTKKPRKFTEIWKTGDILVNQLMVTSNMASADVDISDQPKNPVELFELMWTDELLNHIKAQSIQYATKRDAKSLFQISINEIRVFLAILLISGYDKKPRRDMYWSTHADMQNIAISKTMPRQRFRDILKNIHFADNSLTGRGQIFEN